MILLGFLRLVFGAQFISGVQLLANLFVPLGTVLLGVVIANILMFHIVMRQPGMSPMGSAFRARLLMP
jgi:hypothetical protein